MTEPANDNFPFWPRGLSRRLAASYIGVSPSMFDDLVKDGLMPSSRHLRSRLLWDRHEIDLAFDAIGGNVRARVSEVMEFVA